MSDEIKTENTAPELNIETVKDFLAKNEEGKSWLQSFTDAKVTKGIKTFEQETLPKRVQDEITRLNPAETPEQKKLREMEAQLAQIQQAAKSERLKNLALTEATKRNIPLDLVDFVIGADEESTRNNIEKFDTTLKGIMSADTAEKLKQNGRNPVQNQNDTGTKKYTAAEIAKMDSKTFKALSPNQIIQ